MVGTRYSLPLQHKVVVEEGDIRRVLDEPEDQEVELEGLTVIAMLVAHQQPRPLP